MSTRIWNLAYQWLEFVQFRLLPPTCVLCQRAGQPGRDLCLACELALPVLTQPCRGCALPLYAGAGSTLCGQCLQGHTHVHITVAACRYAEPVSMLITRFKYQRQLAAGRTLTQLLLASIDARYRGHNLPELLLPVPLHPQRLRQRGYNQSLLICRDLGRALHIPVDPAMLQRQRMTPPQQGLSARERRHNLRQAFALASSWQCQRYQRVALIDDVVTTMSTVNEIAQLLQQGREQALEIHLWCLARAWLEPAGQA